MLVVKTVKTYEKKFNSDMKATSYIGQARSLGFALGGLLWILEKTLNDLDPDFNRALIILSGFLSKLR